MSNPRQPNPPFPVNVARLLLDTMGDRPQDIERLTWGAPDTVNEMSLYLDTEKSPALVLTRGACESLWGWASAVCRPPKGSPAIPDRMGSLRPMSYRTVIERCAP